MREVENKWSTLKMNDDIWAKLIYFEKNRRLAKAYVSAPVLTIDGSTSGLDGFRIGLSGIDNTYRSLESVACLRSIGHGIKLKIDSQGNILIRKVGDQTQCLPGQCTVWVKDWPTSGSSSRVQRLSNGSHHSGAGSSPFKAQHQQQLGNSFVRKIDFSESSHKLFDMRKFRMMLEKNRLRRDNHRLDWRQCVSIISFVRASNSLDAKRIQQTDILDDPCWLMLINIIAIDMLKSSIISERLPMRCSSSSLIQNHSLLESASKLSLGLDEGTNSAASNKVSLSSSALHPVDLNRKDTTNLAEDLLEREASTTAYKNSNSTDRIKKLRTSATRYKFNNKINQRRYQSTQQLSAANNTIYTTFNSKYINSTGQTYDATYDTPSSGYNSSSRAGSTGYWQLRRNLLTRPPLQPMDLNHTHLYRNQPEESRLSRRNDRSVNSRRSLSVVDLSRHSSNKPIDLSTMQTSIKMNYDYPSDDDQEEGFADQIEELDDQIECTKLKKTQAKVDLKTMKHKSEFCCDSKTCHTTHKMVQDPNHINHNECAAVHGRISSKSKLEEPLQQNLQNEYSLDEEKKVSRSSIASSSSSSGCADNDYFMSQSSSSMSSSTTSNPSERDQFSQPTSSSGIGGSNSTCDEYDDAKLGRSIAIDSKQALLVRPRHLEDADSEQLYQNFKHKHEKLTDFKLGDCKYNQVDDTECCCDETMNTALPEIDCDCPSVDPQCDCCDCESISLKSPAKGKLKVQLAKDSTLVSKEESIYDVLPASKSKQAVNKNTVQQRKEIHVGDHIESSKVNSVPTTQRNISRKDTEKTAKLSSSGWLERRKYSKILPKFIFSSSNATNGSSVNVSTSGDTCQLTALSGL